MNTGLQKRRALVSPLKGRPCIHNNSEYKYQLKYPFSLIINRFHHIYRKRNSKGKKKKTDRLLKKKRTALQSFYLQLQVRPSRDQVVKWHSLRLSLPFFFHLFLRAYVWLTIFDTTSTMYSVFTPPAMFTKSPVFFHCGDE